MKSIGMKSSIALTTYNGIRWLPELLDSLVNQSVQADEVVIFDDASTDGTFEYLEKYVKERKLSSWRIYKNKTNLGWRKNFRNALFECTGDIIFLADQDDIWKDEKIKEMKEVMYQNADIGVLVSNYEPLYENEYNRKKIKVNSLKNNTKTVEKIDLKLSSIYPMRPGCTYCVRKDMIQLLQDKDLEHRAHDCMLWNYSVIKDRLYIYNKSLIKFRRHDMNASSPKGNLNLKRRLQEIQLDMEIIKFNIEVLSNNSDNKTNSEILERAMKFSEQRYLILKSKSLFQLLIFQLLNYKGYATKRNQLSDIYLLFNGKEVSNDKKS